MAEQDPPHLELSELLVAIFTAPDIIMVLLRSDDVTHAILGSEESDLKKAIEQILPFLSIPVQENAWTLRGKNMPNGIRSLFYYTKAIAILTATDPNLFFFLPNPDSEETAEECRIQMKQGLEQQLISPRKIE